MLRILIFYVLLMKRLVSFPLLSISSNLRKQQSTIITSISSSSLSSSSSTSIISSNEIESNVLEYLKKGKYYHHNSLSLS